jgi:hypothetical protein
MTMKPTKSVWVTQPETEEDDQHRLLMQECAVYLFIITKLNSCGNFDHADQYTANAVMQGKRKTVARAIDRLITKGCIKIVAKDRRDSNGRQLPNVLRPLGAYPIWGLQKSVDTSSEMSTVKTPQDVHGEDSTQSMTSPIEGPIECPRSKTRGRVHKCRPVEVTVQESGYVGNVDSQTVTVGRVHGFLSPDAKSKIDSQLKDRKAKLQRYLNEHGDDPGYANHIALLRDEIAKLEEGARP